MGARLPANPQRTLVKRSKDKLNLYIILVHNKVTRLSGNRRFTSRSRRRTRPHVLIICIFKFPNSKININKKFKNACPEKYSEFVCIEYVPVYVAVRPGAMTGNCDFYVHPSGYVVQHSSHVLALPFVCENRTDVSCN